MYFQIRNVGEMRKYASKKNCKMLVNNFIITHIDYYNALHYG